MIWDRLSVALDLKGATLNRHKRGDAAEDAHGGPPCLMKGEVMDGCVGKRISDSALSCIKGAQTQEEIVKCLR